MPDRPGVKLSLTCWDAADQLESMEPEVIRSLFRETAQVLVELLRRDIPEERRG